MVFDKVTTELLSASALPSAGYRVNVVIPVLNAAQYITKLLIQILQIKGIFVIVVCSNHSVDDSLSVARWFELTQSNVVVIESSKRFAGSLRNVGMSMLFAPWTMFVDADDWVNAPNIVRSLDAVGDDVDAIMLPYRLDESDMWNADAALWDRGVRESDCDTQKSLAYQVVMYPWNRIVRTRLLDAVSFGVTRVHNDVQYHWTSLRKAKCVAFSSYPVVTHRRIPGQLTHQSSRASVLPALWLTHRALVRQRIRDDARCLCRRSLGHPALQRGHLDFRQLQNYTRDCTRSLSENACMRLVRLPSKQREEYVR